MRSTSSPFLSRYLLSLTQVAARIVHIRDSHSHCRLRVTLTALFSFLIYCRESRLGTAIFSLARRALSLSQENCPRVRKRRVLLHFQIALYLTLHSLCVCMQACVHYAHFSLVESIAGERFLTVLILLFSCVFLGAKQEIL